MSRITKSWEFAMVPSDVLLAPISANAKLLFTLYCLFSSREGELHPGNRRLGELMGGISPDTISRAKKELAKLELIEVRARFNEGRRTTDSIHLLCRTHADRIRMGADTGIRMGADTEVDPEEREKAFAPHRTHAAIAGPSTRTPEHHDVAIDAQGLPLLTDDDRQRGKDQLRQIRERAFRGEDDDGD